MLMGAAFIEVFSAKRILVSCVTLDLVSGNMRMTFESAGQIGLKNFESLVFLVDSNFKVLKLRSLAKLS